jgi:23S rRNA U2552 (ribose-2'-O)-methylase RlmE/FtsJ
MDVLIKMAELDGVDFYQSDARSKLLHKILMERYTNFGVVISDMAPNFSGTLF